jgi:hypothetical protein
VCPPTHWCGWLPGWMRAVLRSSVAWLGCVSEDGMTFNLRLARARTGVVAMRHGSSYYNYWTPRNWGEKGVKKKQCAPCAAGEKGHSKMCGFVNANGMLTAGMSTRAVAGKLELHFSNTNCLLRRFREFGIMSNRPHNRKPCITTLHDLHIRLLHLRDRPRSSRYISLVTPKAFPSSSLLPMTGTNCKNHWSWRLLSPTLTSSNGCQSSLLIAAEPICKQPIQPTTYFIPIFVLHPHICSFAHQYFYLHILICSSITPVSIAKL